MIYNLIIMNYFGAGERNRTAVSSLEGWHNKPLYDARSFLF